MIVDYGHRQTDKMLAELERRIAAEYNQACKEVGNKLDEYLRKFEVKDEIKREALKNGSITQQEYDYWRTGQIMIGQRWEEMRDSLAEDLTNTSMIAASMINGYTPEAYALNHNYGTFMVEKGSQLNTSYTLYSRETVERLIRDQPNLLPKASVDIPKDLRYNKRVLTSAVTQGILQGKPVNDIAKSIFPEMKSKVDYTGLNSRQVGALDKKVRNASIRNARTMITSAENAGREDAFKRAKGMGINIMQVWMATLDGRTRHSHRDMDGEEREVGEQFSNGCEYPGDPDGDPSEIYNCRCTLIAKLNDKDPGLSDLSTRNSKLGNMTYEEWKNWRGSASGSNREFSSIRGQLGDGFVDAMETLLNFTPETDAKDLFYKYQSKLKVTDAHNKKGGAYFSPADGGVHVNAEKVSQGDNLHVPYQTAFHEFAHNIDYATATGSSFTSQLYKNGALEKRIKEDWHEFRVQYLLQNPDQWSFGTDFSVRNLLRDMAERDNKEDPHSSPWYDLVRKLRSGDTTKEEVFAKYGEKMAREYLRTSDNRYLTDSDIIKMLDNENMPMHVKGSISDTIGGLMCSRGENDFFAYPLGAGHRADYWWTYKRTKSNELIKVSSENQPLEFFAEVVDGKVANPESLKQMRRIFPKSVKMVEQIIQEMLK